MERKRRNLLLWAAGIMGAMMTLSSGAAHFGLHVDRPAWSSELEQVAEGQKRTEMDVINMQLDANQQRVYENLREQDRYKRNDEDVPDYLLQEQVDLLSKKRKLEIRLEGLQE